MAENRSLSSKKARKVSFDYILMLALPALLSVWFYGLNAVKILCVSVAASVLCDAVFSIIVKKKYTIDDFSALCTGIIIALMMPAGIPLYIVVIASAFAILTVKIPFGGGLDPPFVPAAAGFSFAAFCFRDEVFSYTVGREMMEHTALTAMLNSGKSMRPDSSTVIDILSGNIAGPIGTGCIILIIGCAVYLFVTRRSSLLATAGFLFACTVFALIFPRTNSPRIFNLALELSSGSLMFAAVFLVTDHATIPKRKINKALYGFFTGVVCMSMRKLNAFSEPVCFAVILGNAFSPLLELLSDRITIVLTSDSSKKGDSDNERI